MNIILQERFVQLWNKYFDGAPLPVTFYYTDNAPEEIERPTKGHRCIIADMFTILEGKAKVFNTESVGCFGGKRYLGFSTTLMPNFEYFLSCGIQGKLEGERYKKTPELVREIMEKQPIYKAPAKYIVFSRWDILRQQDEPDVVIFFATPDVLSGLFTLVNFDEAGDGIIAPFGAGCMSTVMRPYMENKSEHPRAVLGMFDVSARPFVPENTLSLAVPMSKFEKMIENMEESFLITGSWKKVQKRISESHKNK